MIYQLQLLNIVEEVELQVLLLQVVRLALLLENITVMHGLGAVSMAHTEADIELLGEVCRHVARRIRPTL